MTEPTPDQPMPPRHPGAILREDFIPKSGKTTLEIAKDLGIARQRLHEVLSEQRPVTAELAVSLGKLFNVPPMSWITAQGAYDIWEETQGDPELTFAAEPLMPTPLNEPGAVSDAGVDKIVRALEGHLPLLSQIVQSQLSLKLMLLAMAAYGEEEIELAVQKLAWHQTKELEKTARSVIGEDPQIAQLKEQIRQRAALEAEGRGKDRPHEASEGQRGDIPDKGRER